MGLLQCGGIVLLLLLWIGGDSWRVFCGQSCRGIISSHGLKSTVLWDWSAICLWGWGLDNHSERWSYWAENTVPAWWMGGLYSLDVVCWLHAGEALPDFVEVGLVRYNANSKWTCWMHRAVGVSGGPYYQCGQKALRCIWRDAIAEKRWPMGITAERFGRLLETSKRAAQIVDSKLVLYEICIAIKSALFETVVKSAFEHGLKWWWIKTYQLIKYYVGDPKILDPFEFSNKRETISHSLVKKINRLIKLLFMMYSTTDLNLIDFY